jgi:hypothetical protein
VQEKGKCGNAKPFLKAFTCSRTTLGSKRFTISVWKPFKLDFAELEESLSAAREEIKEEIQLASEQAAHDFRQLQMIEIRENQAYRLQKSAQVEENRYFRSKQIMAVAEGQARRIQKLVKEEGNSLQSGYASGHI